MIRSLLLAMMVICASELRAQHGTSSLFNLWNKETLTTMAVETLPDSVLLDCATSASKHVSDFVKRKDRTVIDEQLFIVTKYAVMGGTFKEMLSLMEALNREVAHRDLIITTLAVPTSKKKLKRNQ